MNFSVRYVFLGFLALVALCAVFFSLGYVVGYNERASNPSPVVERVAPPAENALPLPPPRPAGSGSTATGSSEAPQAGPREEAAQARSSSRPADSGAPASSTPLESASTALGAGIIIQVTASHARLDAEALAKILKGRGYPVFIVTPEEAKAGDNLFRVQVGPYPSREDAEKIRQKLMHEGFKPFIKRP